MDTRKYIFENGVMKLNPAYKGQGNAPAVSTVAQPNIALTIVSSTQDIADATVAQTQATGKPMRLSSATTASMEIIQDSDYLDKFKAPNQIDGGQILDSLSNIFAKYEVPVGLVNKLLALSEYKLNFIVDDSGSMSNDSDVLLSQATKYINKPSNPYYNSNKMTRWQEAQDRLHIMIEMLAYIPTYTITISFLNKPDVIKLEHTGKNPEQFAAEAHQKIASVFHCTPYGDTPIFRKLTDAFQHSSGNTMHYLFTDGVPSDVSNIDVLKNLVKNRVNPQQNPLTFISCTDKDSEAEWMKEIEEDAPFTAELDDFEAEKREVLRDQGPGFPFSRGFWLICQLAAAINPVDLDRLDESIPFTKQTLDNLLGRKLMNEEYKQYFDNNPNARRYMNLYQHFAREDLVANQIVDQKGNVMNNIPALVYQNNNQQQSAYNQAQNYGQQPQQTYTSSYYGQPQQNSYANSGYQSQQAYGQLHQGYQSSQQTYGQQGYDRNQPPAYSGYNPNYNPGFFSNNQQQQQQQRQQKPPQQQEGYYASYNPKSSASNPSRHR